MEQETNCGIYQIRNLVNNKKYIGQSVDILDRNRHEINQFRKNTFHNQHLQNSFNKYGEENFEFTILVDNCKESELDDLEIANILLHDATDPDCGYNKTEGGKCVRPNDETREKMSKSQKKRFEDPNERAKCGTKGKDHPNYGKSLSEELIQKISEGNKGKIISEETRKKQSEAQTKRYEDPNERLKRSETQKKLWEDPIYSMNYTDKINEYWEDPNNKLKQSKAQRKRFEDPNERLKASEASKKVWEKHEVKLKQSKSQKKRFEDPNERLKASEANKIDLEFWRIRLCKIGFKKNKEETQEYLGVCAKVIDRVCKENVGTTWRYIK
jgi:group I intron endonuclease